jgi:hypothetical protein
VSHNALRYSITHRALLSRVRTVCLHLHKNVFWDITRQIDPHILQLNGVASDHIKLTTGLSCHTANCVEVPEYDGQSLGECDSLVTADVILI